MYSTWQDLHMSIHLPGWRGQRSVVFSSYLWFSSCWACCWFLTRLEYGAISIRVRSFHSISTWRLGDRHNSSGYGFSSVWPLLISGLLCLLGFIRRSTGLDRLLDVVLGPSSTVDVSSCLTDVDCKMWFILLYVHTTLWSWLHSLLQPTPFFLGRQLILTLQKSTVKHLELARQAGLLLYIIPTFILLELWCGLENLKPREQFFSWIVLAESNYRLHFFDHIIIKTTTSILLLGGIQDIYKVSTHTLHTQTCLHMHK